MESPLLRSTHAFERLELLVVAGIIQDAGLSGDYAWGSIRAKRVGSAMRTHAGEPNGTLPGPSRGKQAPRFPLRVQSPLGTPLWNAMGAPGK